METHFSHIEEQALSLPPEERARLAESLLGSIHEATHSTAVEPGPATVTHDPILDRCQPKTEIGRLALAARRAYLEGEASS